MAMIYNKTLSKETWQMFHNIPTRFLEDLILLLHENENFREYMREQVNMFLY